MWRLLRSNRDFRLLYTGTLISLGGDWFLTVALLDLVLQLTKSATLASLVLLCQTLPIFLFTPIAGHAVDRRDRRKLMITVDVLRAFACLLPLLARTSATLPFAFLGVIAISIGSAYFEPASQASLPNIVPPEDLRTANILMGSTWGTMLAVGAAIGGALTMRWGRDVAFVADAISFLGSAIVLWRMKVSFSEVGRVREHPPMLEAARQTFRYARTHPRVLALLTAKSGYGLGAGVIAMLSVFGKEVFHAGAFGIGLLFAARGMGALLGPFAVRALAGGDEALFRSIGFCGVLFALGYIGLGFSSSLWIGAASIFIAHVGGGANWQSSTYGLQKEVQDSIRGRVFSVDYGLVTLTMSISSIAAGILSDHFGATAATVVTASLTLLWSLFWILWTRPLWHANRS